MTDGIEISTSDTAPTSAPKKKRQFKVSAFAIDLLGTAITLAATLAAIILLVHVVLVLTGASTTNDVSKFFRYLANPMAWVFKNLFTFKKQKYTVGLDYSIAAAVYLVAGIVLSRLLKRFAPTGAR